MITIKNSTKKNRINYHQFIVIIVFMLYAISSSYAQDDNFNRQKAKPIDSTRTAEAIALFKNKFTSISSLSFTPICVDYDITIQRLFSLLSKGQDEGIAFHYGLSDDSKRLCYMASLGKLKNTLISFCPFPANTFQNQRESYILFDSSIDSGYKFINESEFSRLKQQYSSNMIKNLTRITTSEHPKMVFHDGVGLNEFHVEYKDTATHIYLSPGALKIGVTHIKIYHVPCFIFGDANSEFELDDYKYEQDGMSKFHRKAMDVGRLCPPNCDTSAPTCP